MVERKTELKRRYHRKKKMAKLKAKLAAAKTERDKDTILKKIHVLSPSCAEVDRGDHLPADQRVRGVAGDQLGAGRLDAERAEVDPQLVGRLAGAPVGLGADDPADAQVEGRERFQGVHADPPGVSVTS